MADTTFKNIKVKVNLGFLGIEGNWEVDEKQKNAAWEIYVELVTRISIAELKQDEGILREALSSLYSIFETTRNILKKYGPSIATPGNPNDITLGHIAVAVLNKILRPVLSKWHPLLTDYEGQKEDNISITVHEKNWELSDELREKLDEVRSQLTQYANVLAEVSGVSRLH